MINYSKNLKSHFIIIATVFSNYFYAQDVQNFGDLQLFNEEGFGVYSNWYNDRAIAYNNGLLGFHGNTQQLIFGNHLLNVENIEINNSANLYTDVLIQINNNLDFFRGNISANKAAIDATIIFHQSSSYIGDDSLSKINAWCQVLNKSEFIFPIGDDTELKPLHFSSTEINSTAMAVYFDENPLYNENFIGFNLSNKDRKINFINQEEFWVFQADYPSEVTLTWSNSSQIENIANRFVDICMVGWHIDNQEWQVIETKKIAGSLEEGYITSIEIQPNDYGMLTLGGVIDLEDEELDRRGYLVSPNGDGLNDVLVIDDIKLLDTDTVQIFNRNGRKIYEEIGSRINFNGYTNGTKVFGKSEKLIEGVYFFIVLRADSNETHQGFFYLDW